LNYGVDSSSGGCNRSASTFSKMLASSSERRKGADVCKITHTVVYGLQRVHLFQAQEAGALGNSTEQSDASQDWKSFVLQ